MDSSPPQKQPIPVGQANPYQTTSLEIGSKIGPHQVQQIIGEGGVGSVYKVWHTGLEVTRAIKILKKGFNKEARERFLTEAKILADISHPNIIEIHSIGYWNQNIPFMEMEYIDGRSVAKLLAQNRKIPIAAAVAIAYFVCQALHYAHTKDYTLYGKVYRGLIHRDVKPDNIVLSARGLVKLMDFGIARPSEISLHTVGDKIMGTLVYLSPEQLSGKKLDHRTDIFSLGAVLYEMVTGHRAFPQKKLSDLVQAKTKGDYPKMSSFNIPMPHSLHQVIERSLALDPNERFDSAGDFGQSLFMVLKEVSPLSPQAVLNRFVADPLSIPSWAPQASKKSLNRFWIVAGIGSVGIAAAALLLRMFLG